MNGHANLLRTVKCTNINEKKLPFIFIKGVTQRMAAKSKKGGVYLMGRERLI